MGKILDERTGGSEDSLGQNSKQARGHVPRYTPKGGRNFKKSNKTPSMSSLQKRISRE